MNQLLREERMSRAEAASLWTTWEQVFKEFLSVWGSPERARARAVGASRDLPTKKYSVERTKGTEVAVACDAWLGTGLGGVAFTLRERAGGKKELTNGDLQSRMGQDQAILLSKNDFVVYTREQLTAQKGNWVLVDPRVTELDLQERYVWGHRRPHQEPTAEAPGRGGPERPAAKSGEDQDARAEEAGPATSKPGPAEPSASVVVSEVPEQEDPPGQSECSFHDSEEGEPTHGLVQLAGGESGPGLPQYQE
jgi:hypothetical protein